MNHRGFDIPGYDASTAIDFYPGMLPEDFHLQVTADGFYRNWPGISDYSDQFQVWYLSTSSLIDIRAGTRYNEPQLRQHRGQHVSENPVYSAIRTIPSIIATKPDGTYRRLRHEQRVDARHPRRQPEFLRRVRAGLPLPRLHAGRSTARTRTASGWMPSSTFGTTSLARNTAAIRIPPRTATWAKFRSSSSSPAASPTRTTATPVFNTEAPRNDAMYFGEHLGGTPQQPYIDAGMRLLDNSLSGTLNGDLATGPLNGLDADGGGGISGGSGVEVGYAQSADNGYAEKRQLQYAFLLTRAGLPVIYTDGYHLAGSLNGGSAFPANAYSNFLGQFGDGRLPNLLYIHNQFARGSQIPKWSDQNVLAFERQDKRENANMSDADGTTMLFMMNCDSSNGEGGRAITTTIPGGQLSLPICCRGQPTTATPCRISIIRCRRTSRSATS